MEPATNIGGAVTDANLLSPRQSRAPHKDISARAHIGMMDASTGAGLVLWSGWKDELVTDVPANVAIIPITAWEELQGVRKENGWKGCQQTGTN